MTNPWLRREVPVTTQLLTDEQYEAHVEESRQDWYKKWMRKHRHSITAYPKRFNPVIRCMGCWQNGREHTMKYYADNYYHDQECADAAHGIWRCVKTGGVVSMGERYKIKEEQ